MRSLDKSISTKQACGNSELTSSSGPVIIQTGVTAPSLYLAWSQTVCSPIRTISGSNVWGWTMFCHCPVTSAVRMLRNIYFSGCIKTYMLLIFPPVEVYWHNGWSWFKLHSSASYMYLETTHLPQVLNNNNMDKFKLPHVGHTEKKKKICSLQLVKLCVLKPKQRAERHWILCSWSWLKSTV